MLDKYRQDIDLLDNEIIKLLNNRFEITKAIGEYKKEVGMAVLNQNRETRIMDKIEALDLSNEEQVKKTYKALIDISKKQQNE